jgi:hypothetical protein
MAKKDREPCAFCPEKADTTGEHIWGAWVGRMLGKLMAQPRYTYFRKESSGQVRTWEHDVLAQKAKVVCGTCNNGWMSEIETRFQKVAADMVSKCAPVALRAEQLAPIAAMGFLKAVVCDHMHSLAPPFFTFEERQSFRRSFSIPAGVRMWLASSADIRGIFSGSTLEIPLNSPGHFKLNVFTYGIGHVVIQVTASRWMKKSLRRHSNPPGIKQGIQWARCAVPFYPEPDLPVLWPLSHLGGQSLEAFINRWTFICEVRRRLPIPRH